MNLESCLVAIRDDAARIALCAERGDLDAPVAGCPGWSLRDVTAHTGAIHRWATQAVEKGAAPTVSFSAPEPDATGAELGEWIRRGAVALADALSTTPADSDTWHPFPLEQKAWVWSRRQAMETMVHRWDAEVAVHGSSELDTQLAATGLTEFFEMLLPRTLIREGNPAPSARSSSVQCTCRLADGEYRMEAVHQKGDAAIRGPAEAVLLAAMGRTDGSGLDIVGDPAAVTAWLDLPGL